MDGILDINILIQTNIFEHWQEYGDDAESVDDDYFYKQHRLCNSQYKLSKFLQGLNCFHDYELTACYSGKGYDVMRCKNCETTHKFVCGFTILNPVAVITHGKP